ncbi:beta-lactamase [Penicillium riverlandense]|uniref:beta-lactamase n=1 Tax=Penicillium riverlandense TaxID=1903569 RepID=UPI00254668E0|nr:beta-lactamase [Penicillium riverlandense]KAJ5833793.1 beta-lactamase [Penicillium riverlandense]
MTVTIPEVHGHCDPIFHSVRDLFQQRIAEGNEVGASLCVNIDGKNVLDIWGGYADASRTKPWEKDTIAGVWSSTKVVTCLAAHTLANRGLLDVNEKVATYWPEFSANGKENVKVSHILSHSSGLPAWEAPITAEDMQDTKRATERLAAQAPWFTPGERSAYQLSNHGHLIGEIVRRISGKSLTQFIADEIAGPLGADFRLGVPEEDWPRTAEMIGFEIPPWTDIDPTSIMARALMGSALAPTIPNEPGFRKSENGAAGGFSNARALARIGSVVSLDGVVDGKQYFAASTLDKMMEEQIRGLDASVLQYVRFALGVALPSAVASWVPEDEGICFWGGWGGSMLIMDRGRRMTIGYAMNKMENRVMGNVNSEAYVQEIYKIVGASKKV